MQYDAVQCSNTIQYDAIRCNTMQYDAIRCNAMQYDAVRCRKNLVRICDSWFPSAVCHQQPEPVAIYPDFQILDEEADSLIMHHSILVLVITIFIYPDFQILDDKADSLIISRFFFASSVWGHICKMDLFSIHPKNPNQILLVKVSLIQIVKMPGRDLESWLHLFHSSQIWLVKVW